MLQMLSDGWLIKAGFSPGLVARVKYNPFHEPGGSPEGGRFAHGEGGGDGSEAPAPHDAPVPPPPASNRVTGIKGMPKDAVVVSRELAVAEQRGVWNMSATERKKGQFEYGRRFEISIAAKPVPGIETYKRRETDENPQMYDPRLATLVTEEKGEKWEFQRAVANDQSKLSIKPLDRTDVIYRGMSAEEYDSAKERGFFESRGEYNIGGAQEGLTYWSNEVDTAQAYANGFAPWQFKATFEKPAYVVAIPKPTTAVDNPRYPNETGIPGRTPTSDIVAVWRGDVFDHQPAERDAIEERDNEYRLGGGIGGSSQVVWTQQQGPSPAPFQGPKLVGFMGRAEVEAKVKSVAKNLNYDGQINVIDGKPPTFELNGQTYNYAGAAHPPIALGGDAAKAGQIDLYTSQMMKETADGLIAHEIEHQKYNSALAAAAKDWAQIMELPKGEPDAVKPDGSLNAPYDKQFPNYQELQLARFGNFDPMSWKISDGVSEYSLNWWISHDSGAAWKEQAMHETLAEMARFKYDNGKFPNHWGFALLRFRPKNPDGSEQPFPSEEQRAAMAKQWRDLYTAIDNINERLAAEKKKA